MSLYICEKCGSIENTALGGYWKNLRDREPAMCSECNFGKWHGKFPKTHWTDYGIEKLLEWEKRGDGSMINATEYFQKEGLV